MGNVKVRKTRYLRQGIDANPHPTTEEILTGVATGVLSSLVEKFGQRVIDKAKSRIAAFAKNTKAGQRVIVHPNDAAMATSMSVGNDSKAPVSAVTLTPDQARAQREERAKKPKMKAKKAEVPRKIRR